jgi:histone H3/H4
MVVMSPAVANGLVLSFMALLTLLLVASVVKVIRLKPVPALEGAARQTLDTRIAEFGKDLRYDADARARARGWKEISKKDILAAYRERRIRKVPRALQGITRYRAITISTASFILALPSFPHFPHLSPGNKTFTDGAGAAVAAIGFVFDGSEFARVVFIFRREPTNSERAEKELQRCCKRLARDVEKEARRRWASETEISPDNVSKAWGTLVRPRATATAITVVSPRRSFVLRATARLGSVTARLAMVIPVAVILYFSFSLAKAKLPTVQYWPFVVIVAALFVLYLIVVNGPRAIAAAWKYLRILVNGIGTLVSGIWGKRAKPVVENQPPEEGLPESGSNSRQEGHPTVESASHNDNEVGAREVNRPSQSQVSANNTRRTVTRGPKAVRELRKQLHDMRNAAVPYLTDEAREAYWTEAWEFHLVRAATRVESNRKQFYSLRLTAIISVITVPGLAGLELSRTGGTAVRWLTFTLSLIAALSIAIVTLFRSADRWLMYRTLSNSLMSAGWALVSGPHDDPQAWTKFTAATEAAKARYNVTYQTAVIQAPELKPNGDNGS